MLISAKEIIIQSIYTYRQNVRLYLYYVLLLFTPILFVLIATQILTYFAEQLSRTLSGTNIGSLVAITGIWFLIMIAFAIVSLWFSTAFTRAIADRYQNQQAKPMSKELVYVGRNLLISMIGVSILFALILVAGLIFFIIPMIIFAVWFSFAAYGVALSDKKAIPSLEHSRQLVKGRWWAVLWRLIAPALVFGLAVFVANKIIITLFLLLIDLFLSAGYIRQILLSVAASIGSLLILPLSTAAPIILYLNLKKTSAPVKKQVAKKA